MIIDTLKRIYRKEKQNKTISKHSSEISLSNRSQYGDGFRIDIRKTNQSSNKRLIIGDESIINASFIFETEEGKVSIGNRTYVGDGTQFISRNSISVGDDVIIAWGCTIYDHNSHSIYWDERINDIGDTFRGIEEGDYLKYKNWNVVETKPIVIENKVWVGFEATILKGVTIGEGAVVGAKSVVTKDVEPWTVVAGNPAKMVKKIDEKQ